ncbi:AimR family lysis-lysogeny pheromone receptor [Bacillus cereus]|uniref:AimR family lysis-lysogeny pheromone receptor n=1 Tax=Bacillus cereus group TaxID=86661 RepID=UPI0019310C9F|nr:AimR family lysis-lysogeny pheromone receptor [Bacillus cereus]MDA2655916.1 AimR family lysis-lysogeny pheromone receptor [Bacillus cereus]
MQSSIVKLQNDLYAKGISDRNISKQISLSNVTVSKFFKEKDGIRFDKYGELLKIAYPNDVELRRDLCAKYFTNTKRHLNKKIAMNYLMAHGELELLKRLVDQEMTSANKENREWASLYELIYKRYKGHIKGEKLLLELNKRKKYLKLKSKELEILSEEIEMLSAYDQGNFKLMVNKSDFLMEKLNDIKDPYLRESFFYKIKECAIHGHLTAYELEKLREICEEVIQSIPINNRFPVVEATVYGVLGESFMLCDESFDKSLFYLKKALSILEKESSNQMEMRRTMIANTIEFLKIHHKVDLENIKPLHAAEQAYLEIQKGNNEHAIEILMKLKEENGELSAFQIYYLGLAKNDKELLLKSLDMFERLGNIFYAQLPKKSLGII